MRPSKGFLTASILTLVVLFSENSNATTCECKQHSAEAEAAGTCSRTEDKSSCTLSFTSSPPEAYSDFVSRLKDLGINQDPREALNLTFERPPEFYRRELLDLLPALFAVSQRTDFRNATATMLKTVQSVANTTDAKTIMDAFSEKNGADPETLSLGNATWLVSYGCVSVTAGELEFMVKTRFSGRLFFCDGEQGE